MKEEDMNHLRQQDQNLREALQQEEAALPKMPADLNERLMQRIEKQTAPMAKQKSLWLYAAIAVAASIALLIVFHFGKEQTPQEPLMAQKTIKQPTPQPTVANPEPIEGEPLQKVATAEVQPSQKPAKKQRKMVMKLVELIPTSEAEPTEMKTLPASVIAQVKAYDQQSDLSRTTGIDDADPFVAMAAQVDDIRQRGKRLEEEILQSMQN